MAAPATAARRPDPDPTMAAPPVKTAGLDEVALADIDEDGAMVEPTDLVIVHGQSVIVRV